MDNSSFMFFFFEFEFVCFLDTTPEITHNALNSMVLFFVKAITVRSSCFEI